MTILMLFPPQWTPVAPSIGIPILNAQLKQAGFNTKIYDLNIEFFNDILNKDFLSKMLKKSELLLPELEEEINKNNYSLNNLSSYPLETKTLLYKYSTIKNYMDNKLSNSNYIIDSIEEALNAFKTNEKFYDPKNLHTAQNISKSALELALLPYAPTKIFFDKYSNPLLKLTYEGIKHHCLDASTNIFLDYYPEKIKNMLTDDINCATISINSDTQIIPGLTLAYLIKKAGQAHVTIGGDYFRRVVESVKKHPELFELFCDSFLVEDSEESIVELAKYCNKEIEIEKISGLIYKNENGEITSNPIKPPTDLDKLKNMTLDGFDLDKYYTPEIVLPIKSNRHCSWDKCTFCDLYYGLQYNEKSPENLVDEIKELQEKYNISHFEFIDSSISAKYFDKMADLILKENLKVNYFSFARLEKNFTKDILNKASKSGLKMLLWGLESANKRIIKLMNKGVDFENRLKIIKNSDDAGIWNFVFTMLGFPTETKTEARETIDFVTKHTNIMQPVPPSKFYLKKHAKIRGELESYGIIEIEEFSDDFYQNCKFKSNGMSDNEISDLVKIYQEAYKKAIKQRFPLWHSINMREHLFLYLTHYGQKWLKKSKEISK